MKKIFMYNSDEKQNDSEYNSSSFIRELDTEEYQSAKKEAEEMYEEMNKPIIAYNNRY